MRPSPSDTSAATRGPTTSTGSSTERTTSSVTLPTSVRADP
jgi:hypothetical protein